MILLTGATGYLGSQIARELARRRVPFRVLVRDPGTLAPEIRNGGAEVAVGDLRDSDAVKRSLDGVDRVLHTAALVKMWVRDPRDFWRINVEGFQGLCRVAAESGVRRIVYTSSFIALGPSADASAGEELRNAGPFSNEYEETKAAALDWLRREGFSRYPVVALFPGVIYGPGPRTEGNLVALMIERFLGRKAVILGSGDQRWSFAFNREVVDAHLRALELERPQSEYVLAGENRSLSEFYQLLAQACGVSRSVFHVPFAAGKALGNIEVARARFFGHSPEITPGVVEIFKHDWVYSSARAERDLGFQITPLAEGLKQTVPAVRSATQG
jgi:NAD+-dependent farnesol dehydrogenase